MLRLTNTFRTLSLSGDTLSTNYANFQTVRWRKPRWVPQAKSKIFKVPPRHETPEEEKLELLRLFNVYRTQVKSMRRYLTYKHSTLLLASADPEEQKKLFKEDYDRCVEINNEWNERQRVFREKQAADFLEKDIAFAEKRIELELQKQEQKIQEVEEIVRREKEHGKHFITLETVDAAIDHALDNPVDYNFAINSNGEKIIGRENNIQVEKPKVAQQN